MPLTSATKDEIAQIVRETLIREGLIQSPPSPEDRQRERSLANLRVGVVLRIAAQVTHFFEEQGVDYELIEASPSPYPGQTFEIRVPRTGGEPSELFTVSIQNEGPDNP